MEAQELMRAGVKITVARGDKHLLLDIRGPVLDIRGESGERLFFHAVLTPGFFPRLKKSIAMAERMLFKAQSEAEGSSILHLVKGE